MQLLIIFLINYQLLLTKCSPITPSMTMLFNRVIQSATFSQITNGHIELSFDEKVTLFKLVQQFITDIEILAR